MNCFTEKRGNCRNCNCSTNAVLHLHIRANGARGFMWVCSKCNTRNPFKGELFISNEKVLCHLSESEVEMLPVIMPDASNRCVVCGSRDSEMHHWAPRAIFGNNECERWPKDYLCKHCHDTWHIAVTPQLVKQ